ncbi:latrophilin-like protein LAT-2 [Babylonia areolata]|uniref:latrophilin-like protein LAT-2 n=1 Tax=Babylonia areolata TaxID=304850 RepID=UPI003FD08DAC
MDLAVRTHNDSLTSKGNRLDIPRKSLRDVAKGSDTIGVFVAIFDRIKWKGLSQIFRLKVEASRDSNEDVGEDSFINTDVILVSVQSTQSHIKLSEDITMTYKLGRTDTVRPVCSSLHSNAQTINTKGCTSIRVESAYVSCTCNHLTSFAVLMSVDRPSTEDDVTSVLTYCCLTLSIVFLLLAFITFVTFGNLKCTRNSIHIHLCACLGLAQLIFMAGAEQTGNKTVCAVIAGVLHFLFLAAFSWMGVEGMQIYMKLIIVFRTTSSFIIIYYGLGYGVPAVVVFVSAAVYHQAKKLILIAPKWLNQAKLVTRTCWLSPMFLHWNSIFDRKELAGLWKSLTPSCLKDQANECRRYLYEFLIPSLPSFLCSGSSRREATRMENLKSQVKGIATLTSIMGITWLFGLLVMGNTVGKVFEYLFVLMNATQGVFVFFFHCFFNKKVQTLWFVFVLLLVCLVLSLCVVWLAPLLLNKILKPS